MIACTYVYNKSLYQGIQHWTNVQICTERNRNVWRYQMSKIPNEQDTKMSKIPNEQDTKMSKIPNEQDTKMSKIPKWARYKMSKIPNQQYKTCNIKLKIEEGQTMVVSINSTTTDVTSGTRFAFSSGEP